MSNDFDEYQKAARRTAVYPNLGNNLAYPTLGLAGEAGEVANKVKKIYRDSKGIMSEGMRYAIQHELGDTLWYIANLATELNISLSTIAHQNIRKLSIRAAKDKVHGEGDER